jgi:hypothetical protein
MIRLPIFSLFLFLLYNKVAAIAYHVSLCEVHGEKVGFRSVLGASQKKSEGLLLKNKLTKGKPLKDYFS